ncbi:PH domain-containing protein [Nakamurella sp. GG22]
MTFLPLRRARNADVFVFRPRTGIAACALWALLGVVWIAAAAQSGGWALALSQLPLVGLASTVVYAACGRPRVIVGPDDVVLRNVVRDVTVPYSAIIDIQTRYTLTLTTADGARHQAWAAPASGRFGAARVTEEERKTLGWSGPVHEIPASAGLRSDAGAAAVAIRRRWQPLLDGPPQPPGQVRIAWATGILAALAIFAGGLLLSILL